MFNHMAVGAIRRTTLRLRSPKSYTNTGLKVCTFELRAAELSVSPVS